ncbi:MAG: cation diffusion facilitator family transporter [Pseudomonadota bacterium]
MKPITKAKASWAAILNALTLALVKFAVGMFTMSLAVLASALDSIMDVLASSLTLFAVKTAEKPPDEDHPFGHGKIEPLISLVHAIIIGGVAAFIIKSAIWKMLHGYHLQSANLAIIVMIATIPPSFWIARLLRRAGERHDSMVLSADALHYATDVWTASGVIVALVLEKYFKVPNADPIISLLISLYILQSVVKLLWNSISQLMDRALPGNTLATIDSCIKSHSTHVRGYHHLRTRKSGSINHIEFHLEIDHSVSFETAHAITEEIISKIEAAVPKSQVTVHSDPV